MGTHMSVLDATCHKLGSGITESILINLKKILEKLSTCLKSIFYALELKVFCIFVGVVCVYLCIISPHLSVDSIFHKFSMKAEKF